MHIGMVPESSPPYVNSRDPSSEVCFNPPSDDITKIEGLHVSKKKSVVDVVTGLGKVKGNDILCVAFFHHVRHRFLEDQQIG